MKIRITFKDPDGVEDAFNEVVDAALLPLGLDDEEAKIVGTKRMEELREFASKWLLDSEYITIEFDTEAGTATVVPVSD